MLRRVIVLSFLVLGLAVGGCGEKSEPTGPGGGAAAVSIGGDIQELVPTESIALLHIGSIDDIQDKVRRIVGLFDADMAAQLDVGDALNQMSGDIPGLQPEMIDRTKPMAVAVVMAMAGGEEQPMPYVILPMKDVDGAVATLKEAGKAAPMHAGDYVDLAPIPSMRFDLGGSRLGEGMLAGDLSLRVELAALMPMVRPMIEQGINEGMPPMPGMDSMQQWVNDILDSAERLDVALALDGTTLHAHGGFTAKEGSPLTEIPMPGGDLAALAAALPEDYPVAALFSMDMKWLMKQMKPLMEQAFAQAPAEFGERFTTLMAQIDPVMDLMGNEHAMAFRIAPGGMRGVSVSTSPDAQALLDKSAEIITSGTYQEVLAGMGMEGAVEGSTTVAGTEVRNIRIVWDSEKMLSAMGPQAGEIPPEAREQMDQMFSTMFGKDGMVVHAAVVDGNVLQVFGDESAMESAINRAKAGKVTGPLAAAIAHAGGKPAFLLHIDISQVASDAIALARQMMPPEQAGGVPDIPGDLHAPMTAWAAADGRHFRGGLEVDLGGIAKLVQAFQR